MVSEELPALLERLDAAAERFAGDLHRELSLRACAFEAQLRRRLEGLLRRLGHPGLDMGPLREELAV